MMLRRFIMLVAVMLLGFAGSVLAAPTTPTTDFTDNGDGTVTHKITGLTWKRCAEGMTWMGATCTGTEAAYTWDQAMALKSSFAGKSDWRLPRMDELVTIVERDNVSPAINTTIFPATPSSDFWSASAYAGASDDAWVVYFHSGFDYFSFKAFSHYVRLVRGGQFLGSSGLYTPSSDFTDNGNGTVTHQKTSLTWKRCAEGQRWAGSTCSGTASDTPWANATAMTQTYAGYSDWRLPTTNELQTLVEYSIATPGPTINTTMFPNTPASHFWSASAYAAYSDLAWFVSFFYGFDNANDKTGRYYVRLVRGGQSLGASSTLPSITTKTDSDRIFDWAEKIYPQFFSIHATTGTAIVGSQTYAYRAYPGTGIYLASSNGRVIVTGGGFNMQDVGAVSDFVAQANAAGF